MHFSLLKYLRWVTVILVVSNTSVLILGGFLTYHSYHVCDVGYVIPFGAVSLAAFIRIVVTIQSGIAQEATARSIIEYPSDSNLVLDAVIRQERRRRYKKWSRWTWCMMAITVLQFVCATYLVLRVTGYSYKDGASSDCGLEALSKARSWKQKLLVLFMSLVCLVTLAQCFAGYHVLRWRSFYKTEDSAWRAHYQEVFDNGIREALCCMGRVKYMSTMEEDEVYSVARLLGDLVAYRASGTGHLELLAGLALLQRPQRSSESPKELMEAPKSKIEEAAALHKFAEAAYTVAFSHFLWMNRGLLLDFGRNPCIFLCVWLYRQGILTPWTRKSQPALDGDNWWRGHAAAFLKYLDLSPKVLRHGRVNQPKCEAAYFVVVLHDIRTVIIAVRGTETPEDLITDGLCGECTLSPEDLDGLIKNNIDPAIKQRVISSFPHHGHSGVVGAARELLSQLEGDTGKYESTSSGLLSNLLGKNCECYGYDIRIVGHSLGGAIASLLGLLLYKRYTNLHVYAYGPLPCLDLVIASACSDFVTSIVYGDEFSSRLSIQSVLRLRAAAVTSLSQDPKTDAPTMFKLARRFLFISKFQRSNTVLKDPTPDVYGEAASCGDPNHHHCVCNESQYDEIDHEGSEETEDSESSLWSKTDIFADASPGSDNLINPFATDSIVHDNPVSQFMRTVTSSENGSAGSPPEMYLPGLVIHLVPPERSITSSLVSAWRFQDTGPSLTAYVADRESFKDIVVSPFMFLDHLPWRCHDALRKVLKVQSAERQAAETHVV